MRMTTALAVVTLVACSQLAGKTEHPRSTPCRCPQPMAAIAQLADERDDCRVALEHHIEEDAEAAVRETKRPRQRIVVKEGAPKRCAGNAPDLLPVASVKCDDGRLCLDEKAQVALAANLAAYEKWVRDVRECEREP